MQFDTALNLVWVVLGLVALTTTARAALGRPSRSQNSPAWLHIVGVALIVASLFPYISATDDALRTEHYAAQHEQGSAGKHSRIDNLMRLYEAMDHPVLCQAREIVLVVFFVSLIFAPAFEALSRIAPNRAGRSPPISAAA
jgi:hypothetical protein